MIASHPPDVLRALAERLRRELGADAHRRMGVPGVCGPTLHVLEREDLERAHAGGVLELDRAATALLLREELP